MIFYTVAYIISTETPRDTHLKASFHYNGIRFINNFGMGERFESNKPIKQEADAVISLVEAELNGETLLSEDLRNDLVLLLENTLLYTSDARARAKMIELLNDIWERYPDD